MADVPRLFAAIWRRRRLGRGYHVLPFTTTRVDPRFLVSALPVPTCQSSQLQCAFHAFSVHFLCLALHLSADPVLLKACALQIIDEATKNKAMRHVAESYIAG
jgi:hypothetical protein